MKAFRLNLCTSMREALVNGGYSTTVVVNAVNSELAKASLVNNPETDSKVGNGSCSAKLETYKVGVTATYKFEAKATIPLQFYTFHGIIAKAEKIGGIFPFTIPSKFAEWLDGFAKPQVTAKVEEKVSA